MELLETSTWMDDIRYLRDQCPGLRVFLEVSPTKEESTHLITCKVFEGWSEAKDNIPYVQTFDIATSSDNISAKKHALIQEAAALM